MAWRGWFPFSAEALTTRKNLCTPDDWLAMVTGPVQKTAESSQRTREEIWRRSDGQPVLRSGSTPFGYLGKSCPFHMPRLCPFTRGQS